MMLLRQVYRVVRGMHRPTNQEREQLLQRVERASELPLLLLAFLMVPLLAGPFLWDLSPAEIGLLSGLNLVIWIAFGVDLVIKVTLSTRRLQYLRNHWLDVLIVAIPFFRPLRIIQLLVYGSRAFQGSRRLSKADFVIAYAFGALIIATTVIVAFERNADSKLAEYPDALWWGVVTVTTVGYGDITPETVGGRVVAAALMMVGIGLFSFITANVASKISHDDKKQERAEDDAEFNQVMNELKELRTELSRLTSLVEQRQANN